jgi:inner membrane protein
VDTLTHALAGALIARATAPRSPQPDALPLGRRMGVGFLAAAAPDCDFVLGYLSPLSYLYHHRGVTHSVLLVPVWAVLLSVVFAAIWRFRPGWRAYVGVTAWCLASHIVLDLITSFGTMIFAPFSDARLALSATFIIDLWFTGIILAGLVACAIWRHSRVPAVAGVAVLMGYVGLQVVLQHRAIEFGEEYARSLGLHKAVVTAVPRPVSPFNWTVIVADDERYHYAHVNLIRHKARSAADATSGFVQRLDAAYRPLGAAQWKRAERYASRPEDMAFVREAFSQPAFRFFRWFAAYPVLRDVEANGAARCAWFHDLRFVTPGRNETPFLYGMCRDEGGAWKPFQLIGDARKPVY